MCCGEPIVQFRSKDGVFLWADDGAGGGAFIAPAEVGGGTFMVESIEECLRLWFKLRTEAAEGRVGVLGFGMDGENWANGDVASMMGTGE